MGSKFESWLWSKEKNLANRGVFCFLCIAIMQDVFCHSGVFMPKSRSPLIPLLVTVALLFLAFLVMILGIDAMHMHEDEELSYRNMIYDFPTSMIRLATRNNQAPLWWIQIWAWQRTAGTSEFAGRINSLLW